MAVQGTAVAAWYNEGLLKLQDCQLQTALVGMIWPRKAPAPNCVSVFLGKLMVISPHLRSGLGVVAANSAPATL